MKETTEIVVHAKELNVTNVRMQFEGNRTHSHHPPHMASFLHIHTKLSPSSSLLMVSRSRGITIMTLIRTYVASIHHISRLKG